MRGSELAYATSTHSECWLEKGTVDTRVRKGSITPMASRYVLGFDM